MVEPNGSTQRLDLQDTRTRSYSIGETCKQANQGSNPRRLSEELQRPRSSSECPSSQEKCRRANSLISTAGLTILPPPASLDLKTFETWRLEFPGAPGAVRVSEFAELQPVGSLGNQEMSDAYGRPANKRDLGHRCHHCRIPFSSLGASLVAEPQQGPTQRFHSECWQQHHSGAPKCSLANAGDLTRNNTSLSRPSSSSLPHEEPGLILSSRSVREASEERDGRRKTIEPIVAAYADEWRRASAEFTRPSYRASSSSRRRTGLPPRPSPLEGLISIEDAEGERRVSRGFSQRAIELIVRAWACTASLVACECAVCFNSPQKPLQLPCSHIFCASCVVPWLRRCALCPMCRCNLYPFFNSAANQIAEVSLTGSTEGDGRLRRAHSTDFGNRHSYSHCLPRRTVE